MEIQSDPSVAETCKVLGISRQSVYALLKAGRLHGYRLIKRLRVRRDSLERLRATNLF
jgi:excisionase family DNA binding protein